MPEIGLASNTNINRRDKLSFAAEALAGLAKLYLADNRPWVVAYSGGKDSTAVLQLTFNMLRTLGNQANKPVFIMTSDTRLEVPNVSDYVTLSLKKIDESAKALNLPLSIRLVQPLPEESFWGKLIGKGYPPPSIWFRWCTSNMKIKPSRREIDDLTKTCGSVILLLGTRISESAQRGRAMQAREGNSRGLNPHHEIPNALVATPIASWTTDNVWEYLANSDCPWGIDHSYMFSLYKQAGGDECPFVVDLNMPPCGNSRFGCWTCTVVKKDKSLQGFINSGEEYLQPLVDFRNWLIELRDKPGYRSGIKRNGTAGPGPFLPDARQEILERLLSIEKQTGLSLVNESELIYIQMEWAKEFDFQNRLAIEIALRYGRNFSMIEVKPNSILPEDELVEQAALENDIDPDLLRKLLDIRRRDYPSLDKWGAKSAFEKSVGNLVEKAARQVEQAIKT
ncbi:MAG: DNA phosphorothioation system sulfurtransferase DndC [Thermodesulfobacteriota bacterium]|nr:DNA phosphorothioation system sulfurtransferase DndC [Thermodesulfobacteriota bacterium]